MLEIILSSVIVLLTHALEAITGFGCTVLAMPFVTSLLGIKTAKILLTIVGWMLVFYIAVSKHKKINYKQFLIIIFFLALGMPVGIYFFNSFPPDTLKLVLGIFIVVVSVIQLVKIYRNKEDEGGLPQPVYLFLLFLGGIIHGAFTSGGPFVVLYAARNIKDKGEFRATLCLMWTVANTSLFFTDPTFRPFFGSLRETIFNGAPPSSQLITLLIFIPFLIAGIVIGEWVHERVDSELFKKITFWVLFATGVFMVAVPLLAH